MPEKIQGPARAATHHPRGRPTATPPTVPMARQPPPPASAASGLQQPRVSSRAIRPPSRLVEAPEDLRLARVPTLGGGSKSGGAASRQAGGAKRDGHAPSKPSRRARLEGGGEFAAPPPADAPFAAAFGGAPLAHSWSATHFSAPSACNAARALDAVSGRWSRAGAGAGPGWLPPPAAGGAMERGGGSGFPGGGGGLSGGGGLTGGGASGFLWEAISVQDESGQQQTLFHGPQDYEANIPLHPSMYMYPRMRPACAPPAAPLAVPLAAPRRPGTHGVGTGRLHALRRSVTAAQAPVAARRSCQQPPILRVLPLQAPDARPLRPLRDVRPMASPPPPPPLVYIYNWPPRLNVLGREASLCGLSSRAGAAHTSAHACARAPHSWCVPPPPLRGRAVPWRTHRLSSLSRVTCWRETYHSFS